MEYCLPCAAASKANGLTPKNAGHFPETAMSDFGPTTNEVAVNLELYVVNPRKW